MNFNKMLPNQDAALWNERLNFVTWKHESKSQPKGQTSITTHNDSESPLHPVIHSY